MNTEDIYNRPALKEINSNEATSGALSANNNQNKLTTKSPHNNKPQQQDFKQLDAVNRSFTLSNDSLSENLYTSAEREKINCFAGNDDLILDSEQLDYSKDILQPQHYSGLSQPTLEDSLVSSLAANFDAALVLNTTTADNTQRNTLSLPIDPESSSSHASSDNETYVECRSFSSGIGDPLHGWEDLVTSVTEMNMDSLENINEQLDSQLDMTPTEATASEFLNLPIEIIESVVPAIEEQMMQMLVTSKDGNIHTEQKVIKGEEISNLDVTTCIKLEAVDLKVASVIENVDTNSCDHEVNDEEKVSEMPVGPSVDDHPINDLNLTTPIDGHHTGELNCTIPVENHPTEDLNRTTPIDGHHTGELNCTIPVDDHPTEDLNQTTPVDGYPTAELNCTKPVDDHLTEDLNQNTPVNGRPIGDFNCSIPVDKYPANNASVNDHPKEDSNSLTPVDDLPKEDLNRTTTTCDEREYCNNVTVEADKLFAAHNKSVSDNNASFNAADTNQGSNLDECIVLTCATVEQIVEKLPTTICESALNVTQDVAHSPSPLQLDLRSASPSQLEGASYSPISPSSKFPIKPIHDNSLFPKSPTKCDPPPEFPTVPSTVEQNRSRSASPNSLQAKESKLNHTIDIVQTSPNGTTSQPNVKAAMDSLSNPMDSTFTANQEMLNATTTVEPAVFDQTFDGNMLTEILPPNRKRSLSPSINNKTVNMDIHEGNNETRDYEPMDVDIPSPNPNRTVSFPSLQSPVSNVSLEEKIKSNGVNPNDTMSFPTLPSTISNESLSEKEKCDAKDEKDVFVEKVASHDIGAIDDMFQSTKDLFHSSKAPSMGFPSHIGQPSDIAGDEDFQSNRLFLNPSDFDFLLTKGNNNVEVDRSSLLLRFDPLLGHSVPVNLPVKAGTSSLPSVFTSVDKQQAEFTLQNRLSPTNEEEEHFYDSNRSFQQQQEKRLNITQPRPTQRKTPEEYPNGDRKQQQEKQPLQVTTRSIKKNVKMSVDVMQDMKIENDCKSIEGIDTQTDEKHNFKMDELEKKIKNEVLKTEDIEKKLKEAEQREEALIKRITEKDKTIAKMNGVIEAYEKAIAELIAEKEQIIQNYEKQLTEVKTDRDSNYHHLTSLETTFSDLHVKYEKSKEMTAQLKSNEESLLAEKRQNLENLRLQEQRYEKMKNHAMQQLEIANKKLESLTKNHSVEITKLKALLKKEEISRASINEQLQQKSRENEELVKICDELINGQGS